MKNTIKLLGIIAIAAVIGFALASCGSDDPPAKVLEKARYLTADKLGNVYELVITEAAGRYSGQENDGYRLGKWTKGEEVNASSGTVASVT